MVNIRTTAVLICLVMLATIVQSQVTIGGSLTMGGVITSQGNPPLSISLASLPNGVLGTAYSQTVTTAGGTAPLTFSVSSGALPPGLSLDGSTGAITGTPTTTGSYPFVIKAEDSGSPVQSATQSFNVPVTCTPLSISTPFLPGGSVGETYSNQAQSAGGTIPITWALTAGSLPSGLTLSSGGLISGTPTTVQTVNPVIQAQDSCYPTPQSSSNSFTIGIVQPVIITTPSVPPATVGQSYSTQFAATGGTSPYSWSIASGTPPSGLSLSSSGVLSGTPAASANVSLGIKVQDSGTSQTTGMFPILVMCSPLAISTTNLPNTVPGTAYSTQLNSTGGTGTVSWSIVSGGVAGLSLSSSGILSGTPTQSGSFTLGIQAQDSCTPTPQVVTASLTLTVISPVSIATSATLPGGTQGKSYSVQMAATGGTLPYSWAGTPPSGLTLNAAGLISGIPASSGSAPFSVQVQDAVGQSAAGNFTIPVTCGSSLSITSIGPLDPATVGQAYSFQFAATGGIAPYSWNGTSIPSGLGVSVNGLLGGIPTAAGSFNPSITVKDGCLPTAQQSSAIFAITISNPIPTLTITSTSPLPAATEAVPYSVQLASTGGTGPNTWSIASGSLPVGLTLSGSGAISGTPTTTGTLIPTIKVADSASHTAMAAFSITVSCVPLAITSTSPLSNGTQNSAYSQQLQASGGTGVVTWSVTGGTLPAGVTLSSAGQLSGTPTGSGSFSATITARDSCVPTNQTSSRVFSITIAPFVPLLTISTTSPLPAGTQGVAYSSTMSASGGVPPYAWTKTSGSLPAGLSLSGAGAITGTPTTIGTSTATIKATDSASNTASGSFTASISCVPLAISTTSPLSPGTISTAYSQQMAATGGTGALTWALASGAFPTGVSIASTGLISGTPSASGAFTPTISVTDSCSTPQVASQQFSLAIASFPLTIVTTSPLPSGVPNQAYSQTLVGSGGTLPYTWSKTAGTLPTGLSLSSAGVISGTPTVFGNYSFTVQVADSAAHTSSTVFALNITGPLTLVQTIGPSGITQGANSISGTFTQPQSAGDLIVVVPVWNDNTTTVTGVTDSKGNSYSHVSCNSQTSMGVWYAANIAASSSDVVTVALSASPSYRQFMAVEYSGVLSSPFDGCVQANGTGTAISSGNLTTTTAGDLLLGSDNVGNSITVVSPAYVQRVFNSGNDIEDQQLVQVGTYNFTPTQGSATWWQTILTAWKTGNSGSGPPPPSGPFTILKQQPVANRPYPTAYYNHQLPGAGSGGPLTHLMANSATMVASFMQSGSATDAGAWNSPGSDDGQHKPLYYGQSTDPVYQLQSCASPVTGFNGIKFHAPSGAMYNQGSFDKEILVWDQTTQQTIGLFGGTCTNADCYALPACSGTLGSPCQLTDIDGGYCSADNWTSGSGIGGGDAISTAGLSPFGNIIRLTEITTVHHINHGLRLVDLCSGTDSGLYSSRTVFPATQLGGTGANPCTATGTAEPRPPNGALIFADYTQAQLDCFDPSKSVCTGVTKLPAVQFELVEALTLYGGTTEDTGGGESIRTPGVESEQAYYFYDTHGYSGAKAVAQSFEAYMNANCASPWCSLTTRSSPHSVYQWNLSWAGIPNQGGAFWQHLHVADQCVAKALQGVSGGCP